MVSDTRYDTPMTLAGVGSVTKRYTENSTFAGPEAAVKLRPEMNEFNLGHLHWICLVPVVSRSLTIADVR